MACMWGAYDRVQGMNPYLYFRNSKFGDYKHFLSLVGLAMLKSLMMCDSDNFIRQALKSNIQPLMFSIVCVA